jgi:murein DD-endopeptidase MepM/ murein hydrolase activator NlpD
MMQIHPTRPLRLMMATATVALIAACDGPLDFDLRDLGNGFDTTPAVANLPDRPSPDNRGVISYPNYQVVVARDGDTPRSIAGRLGLTADTLAGYNGIDPDASLRRGEVLALSDRVAEPSPATGAATTGPIQPSQVDVTSLAGAAIDRAGDTTTTPLPVATPTAAPVIVGLEPIRHQVARGETLFSISRLYGVAPRAVAEWNGLGPELNVREGQFLLIPNGGVAPAPVATPGEAPGTGSVTPVPPSADDPLPPVDDATIATGSETPAVEVPDLGSQQTPAASDAVMVMPTSGSIIRAYAAGRNDGIDIGASAGATVVAAAAGSVAAITTDTAGIQIVVIRHAGGLLTVYTHIDNLTVSRGDTVSQGQPIGSVRAGDPSFLHFEVRRGTDAQDPSQFLP